MLGVVFGNVEAVHCDELIADHPRSPIGCGREYASGMHAALGSCKSGDVRFLLAALLE